MTTTNSWGHLRPLLNTVSLVDGFRGAELHGALTESVGSTSIHQPAAYHLCQPIIIRATKRLEIDTELAEIYEGDHLCPQFPMGRAKGHVVIERSRPSLFVVNPLGKTFLITPANHIVNGDGSLMRKIVKRVWSDCHAGFWYTRSHRNQFPLTSSGQLGVELLPLRGLDKGLITTGFAQQCAGQSGSIAARAIIDVTPMTGRAGYVADGVAAPATRLLAIDPGVVGVGLALAVTPPSAWVLVIKAEPLREADGLGGSYEDFNSAWTGWVTLRFYFHLHNNGAIPVHIDGETGGGDAACIFVTVGPEIFRPEGATLVFENVGCNQYEVYDMLPALGATTVRRNMSIMATHISASKLMQIAQL